MLNNLYATINRFKKEIAAFENLSVNFLVDEEVIEEKKVETKKVYVNKHSKNKNK